MEFRETLTALAATDDLLVIDDPVTDPAAPIAIAAEAARLNGPAVVLTDVPGTGRLACGSRGGPDRMARRERLPWTRLATGLGMPPETPYVSLLERLTNPPAQPPMPDTAPLAAGEAARDLTTLCLPTMASSARPVLTDGILAVEVDGEQTWAPLRGEVRGRTGLRLHVPAPLADLSDGRAVTVALGVPTAAVTAAHLAWSDVHPWRTWSPSRIAAVLDDVPVADVAGGAVPASAEVVADGTLVGDAPATETPQASWEVVVESAPVTVEVERVATRPDPLVPVTPIGEPLSDDTHLTSLVEGARLQARVNGYWGVSPVDWIGLPVEAELGVCLVASEILYAGFEWQLANTLFAYATAFDKVVVLDTDTVFEDLAGALDDLWVKAHPSHDWVFSEDAAPAASAPAYRQDGETGPRLYVNAAWDPRWDEEYIAPKVSDTDYPDAVRQTVDEHWTALGFEDPEREEDDA
jgi:4-hydroxy-3-polyprenylbenzoate decarboxylase